MNSEDFLLRYERQQTLSDIGAYGQSQLSSATVVVVGAGGLGCPVLQYLVGAGVGADLGADADATLAKSAQEPGLIRLIDADRVSISNLHRQILYRENDVGKLKVEVAKDRLVELNSSSNIQTHASMLDPDNVADLCRDADIVLDCADSFAVSYILSDHCFDQGIPFISASAIGFKGYVAGYCAGKPSMRALFPEIPSQTANCNSVGVMGPVVGVMGCLQAQYAINVLLDLDALPLGRMLTLDLKSLRQSWFRFDDAAEPERHLSPSFIGLTQLASSDFVVDLRGLESDFSDNEVRHMSIDDFLTARVQPSQGQRAVLACRSGVRAWRAARHLKSYWKGDVALMALGDQTISIDSQTR